MMGYNDSSIVYSANPSGSDSVVITEGTPGDSSSSNSASTSKDSPGTPTQTPTPARTETHTHTHTHTHNNTDYGARAGAAAHAAGNSAIMAGSLAAGFKMAKQFPTIPGKVGAVLTSVVAGGSAIATKNLADNFTKNIGKRDDSNKLVSSIPTFDDLNTLLMQAFNFTDDYLFNFLQLVVISHKLQWFCVTMIGYYAFLLFIPIEKLDTFYHRILPN
jgi:hypothetical protein